MGMEKTKSWEELEEAVETKQEPVPAPVDVTPPVEAQPEK